MLTWLRLQGDFVLRSPLELILLSKSFSFFFKFNFLLHIYNHDIQKKQMLFFIIVRFFPNSFYADFYGKGGTRKSFASADIEVCYILYTLATPRGNRKVSGCVF